MEKFYTPSEVAKFFGVTLNALKQRAILVEKKGYEIKRNEKGHRMYTEKDFSILYPNKIISEDKVELFDNANAFHSIKIAKKALEDELAGIEETIESLEELIIRKKEEVQKNKILRDKTAEILKSINIYLG